MTDKLTLAAVAVITLCALVGAVVLTALGYQVPDLLPFVVTTGVGVLGGSAVPRLRPSTGDGGDGGDPVTGAPASGSELAAASIRANARNNGPSALHRTDTGARLHPRKAA